MKAFLSEPIPFEYAIASLKDVVREITGQEICKPHHHFTSSQYAYRLVVTWEQVKEIEDALPEWWCDDTFEQCWTSVENHLENYNETA